MARARSHSPRNQLICMLLNPFLHIMEEDIFQSCIWFQNCSPRSDLRYTFCYILERQTLPSWAYLHTDHRIHIAGVHSDTLLMESPNLYTGFFLVCRLFASKPVNLAWFRTRPLCDPSQPLYFTKEVSVIRWNHIADFTGSVYEYFFRDV